MEQIISFFRIDVVDITIIVFMVFLSIIQVFFYAYYYVRPFEWLNGNKQPTPTLEKPSVSVIITAKEEADILEQTLPVVLSQDYPNYEVIVVNNGFTEETDLLLNRLQQDYSHLYHTFLPQHTDKESVRKRIALTIGIKAAKNDVLLFTEADSMPSSSKWIASMMENMTTDKDIVLGYCYYAEAPNLFRRVARFDNFLFSMQYLSMSILGKPFAGIYRNIAYRKKLFFDNKGFADFLNYEHGEANFLNGIMTSDNTAVALSENSFVSTKLSSFSHWAGMKVFYYRTKKHFQKFKLSYKKFSIETASRYLMYITLLIAAGYGILKYRGTALAICGLLYVIQLIIKIVLTNKPANYFKVGKFRFSFILVELLQPFYNMQFNKQSRRKERYI